MALPRTPLAFGLGVLVGATALGLLPFVRYEYARVGSDLQRVDRLTGRQEWAGEEGWWNAKDRDDAIEAEVQRFDARSAEVVRASEHGDLVSVLAIGREVTVHPKAGKVYKLYGTDPDDSRILDLLRKVDARGVRTSWGGTSLADLYSNTATGAMRPASE